MGILPAFLLPVSLLAKSLVASRPRACFSRLCVGCPVCGFLPETWRVLSASRLLRNKRQVRCGRVSPLVSSPSWAGRSGVSLAWSCGAWVKAFHLTWHPPFWAESAEAAFSPLALCQLRTFLHCGSSVLDWRGHTSIQHQHFKCDLGLPVPVWVWPGHLSPSLFLSISSLHLQSTCSVSEQLLRGSPSLTCLRRGEPGSEHKEGTP